MHKMLCPYCKEEGTESYPHKGNATLDLMKHYETSKECGRKFEDSLRK